MSSTLPITPELLTLCRTLAVDVAADKLVYSDDEYQHPHFCGGWTPDGHKGPGFYFSYYAPDGNDYIFHLTNDQPAQIVAGATPTIELEYWKRSTIGPYEPE